MSRSAQGGVADAPTTEAALRGLRKRFGSTQALAGADIEIQAGTINALIGGNGCGKSTAIKILGGVETADGGTIEVSGQQVAARDMTPDRARTLGIRIIHQQGSTFASLSVEENFAAGVYPLRGGFRRIDWKLLRSRTLHALEKFDIDLDPRAIVADLRPGKRQLLAIVRALEDLPETGTGILVLDEPTASLAHPEVERLHHLLKRLIEAGHSVLYVTHRLEELPGFARRVTVLRDGRVSHTLEDGEITHDALLSSLSAGLVAARSSRTPPPTAADATPRLLVQGVRGGPIADANLAVRAGEIVGLAGLAGSGRSSLLQMVFGLLRPSGGTIELDGTGLAWRAGRPHPGVAYVPEDRVGDAAFLSLSLRDNIMAPQAGRFWINGRFSRRRESQLIGEIIASYAIRSGGTGDIAFKNLSGGNQQKAVIARWMAVGPTLLLLDEPTQGVDIGARADVHAQVRAAADAGVAVLVASSDVTELVALCDRVVVLWRGSTVSELTGRRLTAEALEWLVQSGTAQATDTVDRPDSKETA